jgi:hypothetical protein
MQESLGRRVILEHGLISNVLIQLGLVDQLIVANICNRTYQITVPWNVRQLTLPIDPLSDFPNLKIPSADHVCKRMEATIEGELGIFFGITSKISGKPDGYGVFKVGARLFCGEVKEDSFQEGRKLSVKLKYKILQLINQKWLSDGSVIKKIERFSEQGV